MAESEWSEAGCRIVGEVTQFGVIILTCQSQAVTKEKEKIGRSIWWGRSLAFRSRLPEETPTVSCGTGSRSSRTSRSRETA